MKVYQLKAELDELIRLGFSQAVIVGSRINPMLSEATIRESYFHLKGLSMPFQESVGSSVGLIFHDERRK